MQLPTMLSPAVQLVLRSPVSDLISAIGTNNNGNFFALVLCHISNPMELSWSLKIMSYQGPWYKFVLGHVVGFYIILRAMMWFLDPDVLQAHPPFFSALPALFANMTADRLGFILFLGMTPCQVIRPSLLYFRKPTLGPRSCPWVVWLYWLYGCHYVMLANLHLEDPERNPILCGSVRYILGIGVYAVLYHKLQLFGTDKLKSMILVSAMPVYSHIVARCWEMVLQDLTVLGLQPYLAGYSLAAILSSSLFFWIIKNSGTGMDTDVSEKHTSGKGGGLEDSLGMQVAS